MKRMQTILALLLVCFAAASQEKAGKAAVDPRRMDYDYYMSLPFTPDTLWRFDYRPYLHFRYVKPSKARVLLHLDNIPSEARESDYSRCNLIVFDQIRDKSRRIEAKRENDDTFVFDFELTVPSHIQLRGETVFVQPGDTLEIFRSVAGGRVAGHPEVETEQRSYAFQSNSESALINILLPRLLKKLGTEHLETTRRECTRLKEKQDAEGLRRLIGETGARLDSLITSEEVRRSLIQTPLSSFGKNLVMLSAAESYVAEINFLVTVYHSMTVAPEDYYKQNDNFCSLLKAKEYKEEFFASVLRHKSLLLDNPLLLSIYDTNRFFTEMQNGYLLYFNVFQETEGGVKTASVDSLGLMNTFANNIRSAQRCCAILEGGVLNVEAGDDPDEEMQIINTGLATAISQITNRQVAEIVLEEYRATITAIESLRNNR